MLSDEEKNVIDLLKNIDKQKCLMLNCPVVKNNIERQLKIIELNRIIRKQSKEIEELKDFNTKLQATKDRLDSYDKENTLEIEKLKKEIEELKADLEDWKFTKKYVEDNYVSKDKIKAKIEEVKDGTYDAKIVLQSLLEKE